MTVHVVLTIITDDRPGVVETLSAKLVKYEGNWLESSMLSLAGKFAGILLAEIPVAEVDAFLADLNPLRDNGFQIVAEVTEQRRLPASAQYAQLDLVGQDRAGIVRDVTQVLARHHVNVIELDTEVQSASMSGEDLFKARARLIIPNADVLDLLQQELEALTDELMVEINAVV